MEISDQFHSPAIYFRERRPTREGVWLVHSWYGRGGEEINLCPCRERKSRRSTLSQSLYWLNYSEYKGGPLGSTTSRRNMFSYSELVTRYKDSNGSRHSAVGIVTGLWQEHRRAVVRFSARQRFLLVGQASRRAEVSSHPPTEWVLGCQYLKINLWKREAELFPPSRDKVKNAWSYSSTPSTGCIACIGKNIPTFLVARRVICDWSKMCAVWWDW